MQELPTRLAQLENRMPAISRIGAASNETTIFECGGRAGHRRGLHPLLRGELCQVHRAVPAERTENRQLGQRDALVRTLGAEPTSEAHKRDTQLTGQLEGCYLGRHDCLA